MTINRLNQGTTNQVLVKAISGQTTNLLELQDSSGNVVASVGPTGLFTGFGKILQVVRATDTTRRTTTSTSYTDITGMSITITPKKADSKIILIFAVSLERDSANSATEFQITDSSNNPISGAEKIILYHSSTVLLIASLTAIGYATPNTTNATTYKARFMTQASPGVAAVRNNDATGQMYAIEVAA
jgi:hypothetical protein